MPFLRRRGFISESDMRRHTNIASAAKQPADLPPALPADAAAVPRVPAPPVTPPNDGNGPHLAAAVMPADNPPSRPDSPPIQDETPKHRRFSMLRFR